MKRESLACSLTVFTAAVLLLTRCGGSHAMPPQPPAAPANAVEHTMQNGTLPDAVLSGHLYVSGAFSSTSPGGVYRFPIISGVPKSQPDLRYVTASQVPTIALDSTGRLYAADTFSVNGVPAASVRVYKPGSTKLSRTLQVLAPSGSRLLNDLYVAVDPQGHIYVELSYAKPPSTLSTPVVYVFAPGASGTQHPSKVIPLVSTYPPAGLALDAQGELLAALFDYGVDVIAAPSTQPHITHKLLAPLTQSLAVDAPNELYIASAAVFSRQTTSMRFIAQRLAHGHSIAKLLSRESSRAFFAASD